jgi:hypothetical protein
MVALRWCPTRSRLSRSASSVFLSSHRSVSHLAPHYTLFTFPLDSWRLIFGVGVEGGQAMVWVARLTVTTSLGVLVVPPSLWG